ncbi:MAG: hypothetical protein KDB88_00175 [Flavobacteriales bacterium]|nr:hypothetical protein [Flavobacteriales bacterium]
MTATDRISHKRRFIRKANELMEKGQVSTLVTFLIMGLRELDGKEGVNRRPLNAA